MTANNLRIQLKSGILDARLKEIYLTEDPAEERARVKKVLDMYETWFGADPASSQAVETGSSERQNGGGFAGTIQAFVPTEDAEEFRRNMDSVLGEGSCRILQIRPYGGTVIV